MSPTIALAPIPISPKLMRRFYEPIVLEAALIKTRSQGFLGPQRALNATGDGVDDAEQAFKCFANRLAQVCDNQRGGATISAITVLEEADGVRYILGSNKRTLVDLQIVQKFAAQLLEIVGASHAQSDAQVPSVARDALWHILGYNEDRVKAYLDNMATHLDSSIADYERRHPDGSSRPRLKKQLLELKELTKFRENKDAAEGLFFTDCEKLFAWIHRNVQRFGFADAISQQARDGQIDRSETWIELRHYVGRLYSYHLAVETIIRTGRRWTRLFHDFKVTVINSAGLTPNPLKKKKINAHDIIGRMTTNDEIAHYRAQAEELQRFRLDEAIQKECEATSYTHMVHAEVLVLDYVLEYMKGQEAVKFWNNWRYIGSSKPTCRLCSYYFLAHVSGVQVRESHGNLYPHWRVPDVFDARADKQRERLLNTIVKRIREDVIRSIQYQRPQGREHDSNSFSELPPHLITGQTENASMSEMISRMEDLDIAPGDMVMGPTAVGEEDTPSADTPSIHGLDGEEARGVDGNIGGSNDEEEVIVFRGRRSPLDK